MQKKVLLQKKVGACQKKMEFALDSALISYRYFSEKMEKCHILINSIFWVLKEIVVGQEIEACKYGRGNNDHWKEKIIMLRTILEEE